jgi:hypothetical protein
MLFLFAQNVLATRIAEQEPNNELSQANPVSCGDTVYCAMMTPWYDPDHFVCFVNAGDSLILSTFSCNGSLTNTFLVLFDDRDSILASDNDNGPDQFSQINYSISRTGYYTARVLRMQNSADSTYCLCVDCRIPVPENYDLCTSPRIIAVLPYYDEGTTYGMTNQCGTTSPDVFYIFHNPIIGDYFIQVCSEFFDARVQLLTGCCGEYLDDADTGCNLGAILATYSLPIGDYVVMVEGTATQQMGDFSISISAQLPECPQPDSLIVTTIGGLPFLDWPQLTGPMYYIVWQAVSSDGPFEHLGTTVFTYFVDSLGFAAPRRFYQVTAVCPW